MGYLTNFIVYMLAMLGVLAVAVLVFKHTGKVGVTSGKCLKVLDSLSLGARKTLYIVSAGEEKFLIAGDVDHTSLISKLHPQSAEERISAVVSENYDNFSTKSTRDKSYIDRSMVGIKRTQNSPYEPVMKNLAEKIQGGLQ